MITNSTNTEGRSSDTEVNVVSEGLDDPSDTIDDKCEMGSLAINSDTGSEGANDPLGDSGDKDETDSQPNDSGANTAAQSTRNHSQKKMTESSLINGVISATNDPKEIYKSALNEKNKLPTLLALAVLAENHEDAKAFAVMTQTRDRLIRAFGKNTVKEYERYKGSCSSSKYYWAYLNEAVQKHKTDTDRVATVFSVVHDDLVKFIERKNKTHEYKKKTQEYKKRTDKPQPFQKKNQQ